jgi:hypothetical protein
LFRVGNLIAKEWLNNWLCLEYPLKQKKSINRWLVGWFVVCIPCTAAHNTVGQRRQFLDPFPGARRGSLNCLGSCCFGARILSSTKDTLESLHHYYYYCTTRERVHSLTHSLTHSLNPKQLPNFASIKLANKLSLYLSIYVSVHAKNPTNWNKSQDA